LALKSPKGAQKRKMTLFRLKVHIPQTKSATKFLCMKTVSDTVVKYSSAYLTVQKWLVVDVPFYVKIWPKLTHPLQKRPISNRYSLVVAHP